MYCLDVERKDLHLCQLSLDQKTKKSPEISSTLALVKKAKYADVEKDHLCISTVYIDLRLIIFVLLFVFVL